MAIAFKKVRHAPLDGFTAAVPDRAVIGLIGEQGAGKGALLRLAAGLEIPSSGSVTAGKTRRLLGPGHALNLTGADTLLLDQTFSQYDAVNRERAFIELDRCRRGGATALLVSHEESLLRKLCDEVWWLHEGKLMARGDPSTVLDSYNRHVAAKIRAWGETASTPFSNPARQGDGRAEILNVETMGSNGKATTVWSSGESVEVRVSILFHREVKSPVIGILMRNRIGLDVYGTNTELEKITLGPTSPGQLIRIVFRFQCDLCPQDYTITAASHDPDGSRHDWIEEAVAFSVSDSRYTAGVANLRAKVTAE